MDVDRLADALEATRPAVERISAEVWGLAEVGHREAASAQVHVRELEAAGFDVEVGVAGIPTAFVAEWRAGEGAKVGFLSEYDALPGLGNEAVPRRQPRADGTTSGHGCGHNLLGAGLTGAAMAVKHVLEPESIPGTLRVFGCAAEETEGAKVYMAREGLFGDLDACLHWHPFPVPAVMNVRLSAVDMLRLEFQGTAAHAGNEPWKGRSALHAMELAAHGLNLMREHVEPTARVHYVYESGGEAANVVPDYARMSLIIRDADRARVGATTEWAKQIAESAARATQTRATVTYFFGLHDLLPNTPLAERMQVHLEAVGAPEWTDEEQEFARACQRELGLEETGLATFVAPLQPETVLGGASDVAEASWTTPTMGIAMTTMPFEVSLHTWPVTACGGMSIGLRGMLAATEVLTRTALDVLTDADLRESARKDFERRTKGEYVSPLPPEQTRPLALSEPGQARV
jgi:aminobenzoyl-glutamate utilization protein B